MDFNPNCLDFLDHFDRPQAAGAVYVQSPQSDTFDPRVVAIVDEDDDVAPAQHQPTLGVRWVLQWTAAAAVLVVAVGGLTQFACLIAAEQQLNAAARAGATEATLPRATYDSVAAAVKRRLAVYELSQGQLQVTLLQNGAPINRQFRVGEGDRLSITISAPTASVLPKWLQRISPWRSDAPLTAHAERDMPGRKLRVAKS